VACIGLRSSTIGKLADALGVEPQELVGTKVLQWSRSTAVLHATERPALGRELAGEGLG